MENNENWPEILEFWFGDTMDDPDWSAHNKRWYSGGDRFDQAIRQRFGSQVDVALEHGLLHWERAAEPAMALILLLDQFTRNIFRGEARAFSGDERARRVLKHGLEHGFDQSLSYMQRSFFYMPLEHSENLADQNHCVELFERLLDEVPGTFKANIQSSLDFAVRHREIVSRFGRFPHRNQVMGRQTTEEEEQYLKEGGARFGQ